MSDNDELLQQKLNALESGQPLESILTGLTGKDEELAALVSLAAAVRSLPHPQPQAVGLPLGQQAKAATPSVVNSNHHQKRRPFDLGGLHWALVPALALVVGIFLFAALSLLGLGIWLSGPRGARAATLNDVSGRVQVASAGAGEEWRAITNGDRLRTGDRIRTGADSSVTLVFFDGSRTQVGPGSDLTLATVDGDWGSVLRVAIEQQAGMTNNSVVPLRGKNSSFVVHAPSGDASVHGTSFSVLVGEQGRSRFSVDHGRVQVSNGNSQVFLTAGQATTGLPGQALEAPAYEFSLLGRLSANQGKTWVVAGVPFTILGTTQINGDLQIGEDVRVDGRILPNGTWVADSIEPLGETDQFSSFTGMLQSMQGDIWKVSGWSLVVDSDTELSEGLHEGLPVRVTFRMLPDGRWLAVSIQSLEEQPEEPTQTPEPEDETSTPTLSPSPTFTPTPVVTATATLTATTTLTPTATLTSTITSTPQPTETPEPTATPLPSETPEPTATGVTTCTGANPHPEGTRLAQRWGVTYEEIMGWFCQGFGFGEIDLAYGLSQESGVPVTQIFEMRRSGMGWGQIRQQLAPKQPGGPKKKNK